MILEGWGEHRVITFISLFSLCNFCISAFIFQLRGKHCSGGLNQQLPGSWLPIMLCTACKCFLARSLVCFCSEAAQVFRLEQYISLLVPICQVKSDICQILPSIANMMEVCFCNNDKHTVISIQLKCSVVNIQLNPSVVLCIIKLFYFSVFWGWRRFNLVYMHIQRMLVTPY